MLEQLIQKDRRNIIQGAWIGDIIVGFILLAVLFFGLIKPLYWGHIVIGDFVFCVLLAAGCLALIIWNRLTLHRRLEKRRTWFSKMMADKDRLEIEASQLKSMVQEDGVSKADLAQRALLWGLEALQHNIRVTDYADYSDLMVDYESMKF